MIDHFGRNITYLRLSITDRCNLRCRYCMPQGVEPLPHGAILRYEEYLRLVALFARLGIRHVRVTGGEPLVRKDVIPFIRALKQVPGIETVTLTTNGLLLQEFAPALIEAGLDGANVSLDTLDPGRYRAITGTEKSPEAALAGIRLLQEGQVPVKVNAVLLNETKWDLIPLSALAKEGTPVRFIELMPLGLGKKERGYPAGEALALLKAAYPDLAPSRACLGSGPARYFESGALAAPIGLIDAVSNRFCEGCNRVRLTSTGILKPCLCFEEGVDLRSLLREGAKDEELLSAMEGAIFRKPRQHCFEAPEEMTEQKLMSQIGG